MAESGRQLASLAGLVVPLFTLANAGIALNSGMLSSAASSAISSGIVAGLVVGKLVASAARSCSSCDLASAPCRTRSGRRMSRMAALGIGVTVSLLITQLACADPDVVDAAKLGVFTGSTLSALAGMAIFLMTSRSSRPMGEDRGR